MRSLHYHAKRLCPDDCDFVVCTGGTIAWMLKNFAEVWGSRLSLAMTRPEEQRDKQKPGLAKPPSNP